jgi:ArsR family transcriptional regulator
MKRGTNYSKENRMLAIFKVLSNTSRIKILRSIYASKDSRLSVNEIVDKMEISQPTISIHLKLMRIQKILKAKQEAQHIYYSITEPLVAELIGRME